jgi:hypothetical protein
MLPRYLLSTVIWVAYTFEARVYRAYFHANSHMKRTVSNNGEYEYIILRVKETRISNHLLLPTQPRAAGPLITI